MSDKPKIFVFINGGRGTEFVKGESLSEDGHFLAGHLSSNETWFRHDMGLTSDWKHEKYKAHYPDGYELVEVLEEDPRQNADLMAAYAKYQTDQANQPTTAGAA